MFKTDDLIRAWEEDGFRLELFDTYQTDHGKETLAYRLYDRGQLIFEGGDFGPSPLHATDSDDTLAGLLAFLSLRPGDTDPDYFESYTLGQMAWATSGRAEQMGILQDEIEERCTKRRGYEDDVRRPGKFEGEPAYVPYLWERVLNGDGELDDEDEQVTSVGIDEEDRLMFPDLKAYERVALRETDSGFVVFCDGVSREGGSRVPRL